MIALLLTSALATIPDHDALDTASWEHVTTRSTDVGEVSLSRALVDEVRCIQGVVNTTGVSVAALHTLSDRMVTSPDWSRATVVHSEELARDDAGFVLHQHFDSPGWTLSADRFWVVRGEPSWTGPTSARYRWHRVAADDWPSARTTSEALSSRAVEMPTNYGEWRFEDQADGVHLTYRACADIGGSAPEALVSWLTTRQIPSLIEEFVTEATRAGSAPDADDAGDRTHATAQPGPR